jgi:hypothetical protein
MRLQLSVTHLTYQGSVAQKTLEAWRAWWSSQSFPSPVEVQGDGATVQASEVSSPGSAPDGVDVSKAQCCDARVVEPPIVLGPQNELSSTHTELSELLDKTATDAADHVSQGLESTFPKRVDELFARLSEKTHAAEQRPNRFQSERVELVVKVDSLTLERDALQTQVRELSDAVAEFRSDGGPDLDDDYAEHDGRYALDSGMQDRLSGLVAAPSLKSQAGELLKLDKEEGRSACARVGPSSC